MKVVILAGGLGTRIAEFTSVIPKPMIPIGGKPILWHIMNSYSNYGHDEFLVIDLLSSFKIQIRGREILNLKNS
jgi:glucose-1-phosphate cytidylyltransferase